MISVVLSTYNRAHLLRRSLECYANQHLDVPFEVIVLDDDSDDHTGMVCQAYADNGMNLTYIRVSKPAGLWRDCAMTINTGIRAAKGELVIATHPEVMPGPKSVQELWDNRAERTYLACKVYYLTPGDQQHIEDAMGWPYDAPGAVRTLPNFYSQHSATGLSDYAPQEMDKHTVWGSWVFGGFTKETWRWFGGFTEFSQWGSIDVDFLNRRNILGIPTYTAMAPDSFCVHQNHDVVTQKTDVLTPRDMDKAMQVPFYRTPEEALLRHI